MKWTQYGRSIIQYGTVKAVWRTSHRSCSIWEAFLLIETVRKGRSAKFFYWLPMVNVVISKGTMSDRFFNNKITLYSVNYNLLCCNEPRLFYYNLTTFCWWHRPFCSVHSWRTAVDSNTFVEFSRNKQWIPSREYW